MNRMNHFIMSTIACASLGVLPATAAMAQDGPAPQQATQQPTMHREGLLGAALQLSSLTPQQRSQIEQLVSQRKAASVPVRQADAQLLTQLAAQVEQANIDTGALEPSLSAEQSAAATARNVEVGALNQLHATLSPQQRAAVVDAIESRWSATRQERAQKGGFGNRLGLTAQQKAQIKSNFQAERKAEAGAGQRGRMRAALESFRGDTFDASAMLPNLTRGAWAERAAEAIVPVLTPAQRTQFAVQLRNRAARESQG